MLDVLTALLFIILIFAGVPVIIGLLIFKFTKISKSLKIAIVSIVAIVWVAIVYFITTATVVVCDPVHHLTPCEEACQEIINGVGSQNASAQEEFMRCIQNCYK